MFRIFFALFMAFAYPAHKHTPTCQHNTVSTLGDFTGEDDGDDDDDTGGDGGHVPPDHP